MREQPRTDIQAAFSSAEWTAAGESDPWWAFTDVADTELRRRLALSAAPPAYFANYQPDTEQETFVVVLLTFGQPDMEYGGGGLVRGTVRAAILVPAHVGPGRGLRIADRVDRLLSWKMLNGRTQVQVGAVQDIGIEDDKREYFRLDWSAQFATSLDNVLS